MEQEILQFVAVTSAGRAYDIDFPLHPQTRSARVVSDLITALLEAISQQAESRQDISDGDILQALAMTLAIRGRMLEAMADTIAALSHELYESAWGAARDAQSYAAARA
ncbi:MAG: hypothetical protein KDI82_10110 [Gammaproteobacteria bacterium]|nr:hypothetical protein [Gammaproteobacteria bacterium]